MPNSSHTMPNPTIIPILWGHDYVANPATAKLVEQLVSDLVTGPFVNGCVQYGVRRGRVTTPVIIDDTNPPKAVVYRNQQNQLQDDITKKLISWIQAGKVPPLPPPPGIDQFYLIIPPSETTPQTYNNATDPIGNGIQGWHNEGVTNPSSSVPYYWAIVKTNDCGNPNTGQTFVNNFAQKVAHELVEQLVDRNGTFKELGDPCNNVGDTYRAGRSKNTGRTGTMAASADTCRRLCREASKLWIPTSTFSCSEPTVGCGSRQVRGARYRPAVNWSAMACSPSRRST